MSRSRDCAHWTDRQWSVAASNDATTCIAITGSFDQRLRELEAEAADLRNENVELHALLMALAEMVEPLLPPIASS